MSASAHPPSAQEQPPTAAERQALRVVLGKVPPTSRPTVNDNVLVHLYSANGRRMTLASEGDLFLIAQDAQLRGDVRRIRSTAGHHVTIALPCTLEFNVAWSVARQSHEEFPINFQCAVIEQISRGPNITSATLPLEDRVGPCEPVDFKVSRCTFSQHAVPGTPAYNIDVPLRRHRQTYIGVIPIFKDLKVLFILVENHAEVDEAGVPRKDWVSFTYCTNCRAEGSVSRCTHWYSQLKIGGTFKTVGDEHVSAWDRLWGGAHYDNVALPTLSYDDHAPYEDELDQRGAHPRIKLLQCLRRAVWFHELAEA